MSRVEPPSWLTDRVYRRAGAMWDAGVRLGGIIACGTQGCVFDKQGEPARVYKVCGPGAEVEVTQTLLTVGETHPSVVRTFGLHEFLDAKVVATWGEKSARYDALYAIERERLSFDDARSDAALDVLSAVEATFDMEAPRLIRSPWDAERIVRTALRQMAKSDLFAGEPPPGEQHVLAAIALLDALKWLYAQGWHVGDLWAVGLGRGYGTKPENVGWRGATPVIADLGLASRRA